MLMCHCIPVTLHDQAKRGELARPVADEWLARGKAACLPVELALQARISEGEGSHNSVFRTHEFISRASLGKVCMAVSCLAACHLSRHLERHASMCGIR